MKIYLIRHGQTTGDIEDRFGGDYDDELTELGEKQAADLAQKVKVYSIEKIYHSPRKRAVKTAQILSEKIGNVPLEEEDSLRERNAYGILTGLVKSEAKLEHPDLVEELKDPKATIEGAEEYESFKQRVLNVFQELAGEPYQTIAIITHGGVISCFLREVIGRERKTLDDCAVIELEANGGDFVLKNYEGLSF